MLSLLSCIFGNFFYSLAYVAQLRDGGKGTVQFFQFFHLYRICSLIIFFFFHSIRRNLKQKQYLICDLLSSPSQNFHQFSLISLLQLDYLKYHPTKNDLFTLTHNPSQPSLNNNFGNHELPRQLSLINFQLIECLYFLLIKILFVDVIQLPSTCHEVNQLLITFFFCFGILLLYFSFTQQYIIYCMDFYWNFLLRVFVELDFFIWGLVNIGVGVCDDINIIAGRFTILTANKNNNHLESQVMKKNPLKPQQSCTQIGKYKFIPPSKLQKVKNTNHFNSLIDANSSTIDQDFLTQNKSDISQPNLKIKNMNQSNIENEPISIKKEQKIMRSISNPRLQHSNSRNAVLTQKTQPCEGYRNQLYLDRLNQVIQEMQDKQMQKNSELAALRQQNRNIHVKLQKNACLLNQKNKLISELTVKIQHLECEVREKNQEHSLIIQSLKKVIESQLSKINQLKTKITKLEKTKNVCNTESQRNSLKNYKVNQSQLPVDTEKQGKSKNFIKSIRKCLNQNNDNVQQIAQSSLEQSNIKKIANRQTTPDFGARTPGSVEDDLQSSQIQSEEYEQNGQLTLSRISQSLQEDLESSRQNVGKQDSCFEKTSINKVSTHQQLLDQIDMYLSKRTNFQSQKFKK